MFYSKLDPSSLLVVLALFSATLASPILSTYNDVQPTINLTDAAASTGYTLTVQTVILAVILIVFGLFLTFFGSVHFRLASFLMGFYGWGTIAWIILANAEPSGSYGPNRLTIYLVVCLVIGFLAGLMLACCFHLGLWLLGAYGGFILALWILAWRSGGVIQVRWGQGLFIGLMALAGLFTTFFFEWGSIILFTSIIGAYSVIFGLDIFIDTGLIDSAQSFLDSKYPVAYVTNWRVYGMLAGALALALLGIVVQRLRLRGLATTSPGWTSRYGRYGRYSNNAPAAVDPSAAPTKRRRCWPF